MAVNKISVNGETLIDLTGDTVTPQTLLLGETAHDASGSVITGELIARPKNYLHNWYLCDAINQRSKNTWTFGSGEGYDIDTSEGDTGVYICDRWLLENSRNNRGTVILNSYGLTVNLQAVSSGGRCDLTQRSENQKMFSGKDVTLSAWVVSDNGARLIFAPYSENAIDEYFSSANGIISATVNSCDTAVSSVTFSSVRLRMDTVGAMTVKAAKLELNPYQTLGGTENGATVLSEPLPNKNEELEICKRYFERIKRDGMSVPTIGTGIFFRADTAAFAIPVRPKIKAVNNTAFLSGTVYLATNGKYGAGSIAATEISGSGVSKNQNVLGGVLVIPEKNGVAGEGFTLTFRDNSYIDISAEL